MENIKIRWDILLNDTADHFPYAHRAANPQTIRWQIFHWFRLLKICWFDEIKLFSCTVIDDIAITVALFVPLFIHINVKRNKKSAHLICSNLRWHFDQTVIWWPDRMWLSVPQCWIIIWWEYRFAHNRPTHKIKTSRSIALQLQMLEEAAFNRLCGFQIRFQRNGIHKYEMKSPTWNSCVCLCFAYVPRSCRTAQFKSHSAFTSLYCIWSFWNNCDHFDSGFSRWMQCTQWEISEIHLLKKENKTDKQIRIEEKKKYCTQISVVLQLWHGFFVCYSLISNRVVIEGDHQRNGVRCQLRIQQL